MSKHNHDEDAAQGRMARSLFRTDSDTSSSEEEEGDVSELAETNELEETTTVRREILNIQLEERPMGGSIAERLWPAAEYLAEYLLQKQEMRSVPDNEQRLRAPPPAMLQERLDKILPSSSVSASSRDEQPRLLVLELGAGVGLTGLALAAARPCHLLLTDLDEALPLLRQNAEHNQAVLESQGSTVTVQRLAWGVKADLEQALAWVQQQQQQQGQCPLPLLILAADCVYWEHLQKPLEESLTYLLTQSPASLCLLAGMRRWKRDNAFYQSLLSHADLVGHLVQERVERPDEGPRQVMRIYGLTAAAVASKPAESSLPSQHNRDGLA